jgi:hypothetical protein
MRVLAAVTGRCARALPAAAFLALAAAGALAPPAGAQVIIFQRPTEAFIAFEAERNATIVNPPAAVGNLTFNTNFADATASGGNVLYVVSNGTDPATQQPLGAPTAGTATYNLRFAQPGTYTLYYRWKANGDPAVQTGGNEANSFWVPVAFGADPSVTSVSNGLGTGSTPPSTTYNAIAEPNTFTVTAAQVGVNQTFRIQARESDIFIDRFIFSSAPIDVANGSTTAFDAIPNSPIPEPTSASLVLAAAAAGFVAHRRARRK